MYQSYAVMWKNMENGRVFCDTFFCQTESEARHDFRECYRHGEYIILAVVAVPE